MGYFLAFIFCFFGIGVSFLHADVFVCVCVCVLIKLHITAQCVYVCVLSSHLFWTSGFWTYQPGSQEEDHTGFLHLPSAVLAVFVLARRIQPFFSLVDREVEFCVLTN